MLMFLINTVNSNKGKLQILKNSKLRNHKESVIYVDNDPRREEREIQNVMVRDAI